MLLFELKAFPLTFYSEKVRIYTYANASPPHFKCMIHKEQR